MSDIITIETREIGLGQPVFVIAEEMLNSKHPSTGLSLKDIYNILGKRAKENISVDFIIQGSHVGD